MRRRMVLLAMPLLALTGCTSSNTPQPVQSTPTTAASSVPTASTLSVATPLPAKLTAPNSSKPVVGVATGSAEIARGSLTRSVGTLWVTITCQGDGFPSIHTSDGFTANADQVGIAPPEPGSICGAAKPITTSYGLADVEKYGKLRYTITPHGHIVWAVTFSDQT